MARMRATPGEATPLVTEDAVTRKAPSRICLISCLVVVSGGVGIGLGIFFIVQAHANVAEVAQLPPSAPPGLPWEKQVYHDSRIRFEDGPDVSDVPIEKMPPSPPSEQQETDYPCWGLPPEALVRMPDMSGAVTSMPCGKFGPLRVVVNTGVGYEAATLKLVRSLRLAGFDDWPSLVIVNGGDAVESGPVLSNLTGILGHGADAADLTGGESVVIIRTKFMNVDLTGYSMLYRHREHPLVKSTAYMYLLGTTLVTSNFCEQTRKFRMRDWSGLQYHTVHIPASNMGVFSHGIIEAYKTNFDALVTKHQGLLLEFGQPVLDTRDGCGSTDRVICHVNEDDSEPCLTSEHLTVRPLAHFATVTYFWGARYAPSFANHFIPELDVDLYQVGTPRRPYSYPSFGLVKMIVMGGNTCTDVAESPRVMDKRKAFSERLCVYPEFDEYRHACPAPSKCVDCEVNPAECFYPPQFVQAVPGELPAPRVPQAVDHGLHDSRTSAANDARRNRANNAKKTAIRASVGL